MRKLIAISSIDFDMEGARVLPQHGEALNDNRTGARRVSRTATLDGGAVVYDTGYSVADRNITVSTDIVYLDWIQRMVKLYGMVNVITEEGAFRGVPKDWRIRDNRAEMEILIMEEI